MPSKRSRSRSGSGRRSSTFKSPIESLKKKRHSSSSSTSSSNSSSGSSNGSICPRTSWKREDSDSRPSRSTQPSTSQRLKPSSSRGQKPFNSRPTQPSNSLGPKQKHSSSRGLKPSNSQQTRSSNSQRHRSPNSRRSRPATRKSKIVKIPPPPWMKRGADRDMGSPLKRARNLGQELRILIPSRNAGSIIGKGGSNITRLRNENKATVSVPDCPGPERLITIAADDIDTTFNVLSEIVPLLEDAGSKDRSRGSSESTTGTEVRILLHHTQVGCIIGKGGGKIKELRESSGAQIKVYGSCCPRSTDRVVAVSGSTGVVLTAVKQIVTLTTDSPIKGMSEQYDPHNYDELYATQYGGYGEPRSGAGGYGERYRPMGSGGGGARMAGPPRGGGGGGGGQRYRNGGGSREGRSDGSRGGGSSGSGGGRHRSGGSGSRSNGVGRGDGYEDYGEERTMNQVTIPKEYAGAIIGKGGSRIRRIRAESGANITIDEALPGATDRIITINGAPGQIRMAQYLLQQSIRNSDHGELKEH